MTSNDNGKTTILQRAQWEAHMRHQPREYSFADKVFRHPVVLVLCLVAFGACFFSVVFSVLKASGVL
jgi:hypothetical protein